MAIRLADAYVRIFAKTDELDRDYAQAERKTSALASVMTGVFQGIGQRAFDFVAEGVRRAVSEIGHAVDASSDLAETINKTTVVFRESTGEILEWSKSSATALGQSQQQALEAASGFGGLFTTMGLTREEAVGMSKELVELASDMASFHNLDPAEALEKLRSGLVGETEPLRAVQVLLSEAAVQAKAMALGLASSASALTEQDKVLARYQLILEQTTLIRGDFINTAEGAANAERILASQLENSAASLGNVFRPAYEVILNTLNDLAPQMTTYAENIIISFANGLASAIHFITPSLLLIRDIFSAWLSPGSPPKLLPNLTKWGRGALQAYLDGFKAPNVKAALDNVGKSIEAVLRGFVATGKLSKTDLISRVLGSRSTIERAVREFAELGRVTSRTMADLIRTAGPAGASVVGLVRAYFDLQKASQVVTKAQEELNRVTEKYDKLTDPLRQKLSANQGQQQSIRDNQRIAGLRDDIADAALAQSRAEEAAQEIEAIRLKQRLAGNQTWFEQVQDAERIAELEGVIADASAQRGDAELARLEIQEIQLQQQIDNQEAQRDAALAAEQARVDAARAIEEQAQTALRNEQAIIDLQLEQNRLIAEELRLQEDLEQQRLEAIRRIEDEQRRAAEDAQRAIEDQQRDAAAVDQARFEYEFSIADTPEQLALLQQRLAQTEEGTVDYFRILTRLSALQEQYARELAEVPFDEAAAEAEAAANAQWQYQFAIADTAGKLALLNERLAGATEGSTEYYQLLTQIFGIQQQYAQEQERLAQGLDDEARAAEEAAAAQLQYQLAITDTAGKIALLTGQLAGVEEGSAEYYRILTQLAHLQQQYTREQELAEQGLDESSLAAQEAAEAQWQYQFAIADTAGKIALLNERLAAAGEGSAEYYRILTQLFGLQQQYNQELENVDATDAAADAQFQYQLAIADTAGKIELLTQKLAATQEGSAEYYRILTQLAGLQERYADELSDTAGTDAATEAQFAYQFSIADTAGKLELLRQKLAETEEGTSEYYNTLTQITLLERQYQAQIEDATDAQFNYQLAIADTPEKIALLQQALADTTEGSAEYYRILGQISQLEESYQGQLESDARQKATEAERKHKTALQEAEKALREQEKAVKDQQTELGRIADAQFRYELALSDTAGKLELYKQKLAEAQPGSVEYFDLLTKIHGLEVQHNTELERANSNLATLGQTDISSGLTTGAAEPLSKVEEAGKNLATTLEGVLEALNAPPRDLPGNVQEAVDSFNGLTEQIGLTIGAIGTFVTTNFGPWAAQSEQDLGLVEGALDSLGGGLGRTTVTAQNEGGALARELTNIFGTLTTTLGLFTAVIEGDWSEVWRILREEFATFGTDFTLAWSERWDRVKEIWNSLWSGDLRSSMGQWLTDTATDIGTGAGNIIGSLLTGLTDNWWQITEWWRGALQWIRDQLPFSEPADSSSPLRGLKDAGIALLGGFLEGLQQKWVAVSTWWEDKLQWLRDQLPGSEPADLSSPLRGLSKTGRALVEMVQTGIDQASFNINPLADRLLMQPASIGMPTGGGNSFSFEVNVVIEGDADEETVRRGVELGIGNSITQLMRQRGLGI